MSHDPLSTRCRLAPGVYLARQEDIVRLLDLDRGRFYGLDAIASLLLTLTLEHGAERAITDVAHAYRVEETRVRKDLETLQATLRERRLLDVGESGHSTFGRRLPRWLSGPCRVRHAFTAHLASRMLRRAWWSLRIHGWASTLELWRRPTGPIQVIGGAAIDAVDTAIRDAAALQLLFPVACKERAIVGYHVLRVVHDLPAALVIGVQHYPFGAHAWVEIGGRIVTDDAGHCADFEPVARFE